MKTTRKLLAMVLTVIMVMSLATTAFAAEGKGTVENETGRAYKAYQIFSGTQADGSDVLGNIAWGTGINVDTFLAALNTLEVGNATPFAACTTAADVAEVLKNYANNTDVAKAFANLAEKHLTDKASDVAATGSTELDSGYYLLIDQTNVTGQNDAKNPALLQITNGANLKITKKYDVPEIEKAVTNNDDSSDYNIGDEVEFTLTATLPSTFEGYETYKLVFVDTMSDGLTYKGITSVTVDGTTLNAGEYTVNHTNGNLTITIANVLVHNPAVSSNVVVVYTATLNSNAVIGTDGNPNTVKLKYSNDPNWEGGPGSDDEPTGETPEETVKVYTWEIPVFKYTKGEGETKNALAGAGFTLYDGATAVNLTRVGETNVYKVDPNGTTTEIVTGSDGRFEIEGLEKGTYVLKETTTPAGYNTCADVTVIIGENGALTVENTPVETVEILNQAGSTLPETGGMGTTLFYILGGILMVGAAVLLVTKRRMNMAE